LTPPKEKKRKREERERKGKRKRKEKEEREKRKKKTKKTKKTKKKEKRKKKKEKERKSFFFAPALLQPFYVESHKTIHIVLRIVNKQIKHNNSAKRGEERKKKATR